MAETAPIGGYGAEPAFGKHPDMRAMATELRKNIDQFNDLIPPRPDQIDAFGAAILTLDVSSQKALSLTEKPTNKLMGDIQDSALTVQQILTQPLSIGNEHNVSLISAAKRHKSVPEGESDLTKIGMTFTQYPDQTHALKTELSLTSHDLKS